MLPPRGPGADAPSEWSPPHGGAWLHVGAHGTVTAFTGKVEVGQGTRNALRLLVAEELRVPVERVRLVAGDTDLSPWDMGTFGSRSMPDAGPALRAVAGAARLALDRLGTERGGDGAPSAPGPGGALAVEDDIGRRLDGRRELIVLDRLSARAPATSGRPAGRAWIDPAGDEVVRGAREFVSDLRLPGMAFGTVVRPPCYGDTLIAADTRAARALPGVHVVEEPGFVGVVAATPWEARGGRDAIVARWKSLDQPAEADIEAHLREHPITDDAWDEDSFIAGDPDRAFGASHRTLRATYRTAYIAHVPLEPRAAVARWDGDRVTVWVGTQTPFRSAEHVARALGLPPEHVRVIVPPTGSGFGGKHGGGVALEAARLARAAGRPVQVAYTREEEFRYGYLRPMAIVDVRASLDDAGTVDSWSFHNVNAGSAALRTPYRIANQRVDNVLARSPLPQGSYRALGATANTFAREVAMDELARRADAEPLAFRLRHLIDDRLTTVLRRAAETAAWPRWQPGPGRGHGLALSREKGSYVATVAEVEMTPDRAVRVARLVTAFEAGAIVHPDNLASQVEGAMIMAVGGALFERIRFEPGRLTNASLGGYRVPRFSDAPPVEVVLIDRPDLPSAGAGETPLIAVAPALANALFDASGVRLRSLPLLVDGKVPRDGDEGLPGSSVAELDR